MSRQIVLGLLALVAALAAVLFLAGAVGAQSDPVDSLPSGVSRFRDGHVTCWLYHLAGIGGGVAISCVRDCACPPAAEAPEVGR